MPRRSTTGQRGLYRVKVGGVDRWRLDVRYTDPKTRQPKRYSQLFPKGTLAETARKRAMEVVRDAVLEKFDPDREPDITLAPAFDRYMGWAKVNKPKALERRRKALDRLLAVLGDVPVSSLTPPDVERFKAHRKAGGASPGTVNRDLEVLGAFLRLASTHWKWITHGLAAELRAVPHLREPPGRTRYLQGDEEQRLMNALPENVRPIFRAALLSGMRQGELVLLRKSSVDLANRLITLVEQKNGKVGHVHVNDALAAVLDKAMKASRSPYVFVNLAGEPYTCDGVRTLFRRAREKAKVENFKWHDGRHTTATRLRQAGAGLDAIAIALRQSSLQMAKRYAHVSPEMMKATMATLPAPVEVSTPLPQTAKRRPPPRRRKRPQQQE